MVCRMNQCRRGHDRGGRDRDDPGEQDASSDAPADALRTARRADAHDRAGDDVRRRDGHAEMSRADEDGRGRRLGREPMDGLELDHAVTHRVHDPPAADGRPERQRGGRHDDDPDRDFDGRDGTGGEQRQCDDAHGLLGVVRAVANAMYPAEIDLEAPEDPGHRLALGVPEDPVQRRASAGTRRRNR